MAAVIGNSADPATPAVQGTSNAGIGVSGVSVAAGTFGLPGDPTRGIGVSGTSTSGVGVFASSQTNVGIFASSQANEGLHAESNSEGAAAVAGINKNSGPGVYGVSEKFDAVIGLAKGHGKLGVAGYNDNGIGVFGRGGHRAGFFEGDIEVTGAIHLGGADYAEELPRGSRDVLPGYCVVLGEDGCVLPCSADYDTRVAGVISGAGGLRPAIVLDQQFDNSGAPVALMGKAYVWVDADRGPVRIGDMLTTSSTDGHAMIASDNSRAFGAVIGKALTCLASGRGLVRVFLSGR